MRAISCLAGGGVAETQSKRKALSITLHCLAETLGGVLGLWQVMEGQMKFA